MWKTQDSPIKALADIYNNARCSTSYILEQDCGSDSHWNSIVNLSEERHGNHANNILFAYSIGYSIDRLLSSFNEQRRLLLVFYPCSFRNITGIQWCQYNMWYTDIREKERERLFDINFEFRKFRNLSSININCNNSGNAIEICWHNYYFIVTTFDMYNYIGYYF